MPIRAAAFLLSGSEGEFGTTQSVGYVSCRDPKGLQIERGAGWPGTPASQPQTGRAYPRTRLISAGSGGETGTTQSIGYVSWRGLKGLEIERGARVRFGHRLLSLRQVTPTRVPAFSVRAPLPFNPKDAPNRW